MSNVAVWGLLTQGDRPDEVAAAVASIGASDVSAEVVVLLNGGAVADHIEGARVVAEPENLGVPGGRQRLVEATDAPIVVFLDDDARVVSPSATAAIVRRFERSPALGAISFRIVDDEGSTARRHVPRFGSGSADRGGPVGTFLGGACAVRRDAYLAAGGYWPDLFSAHEELVLAWRLLDHGYEIAYAPEIEIVHPHTPISRHAAGWRLTGRNRVLIARRTLPWPVALIHVTTWLFLGWVRAPDRACRRAYIGGWWSGWSMSVDRRPIRWRTVGRLTRLGRPPVL